MDKTPTVRKPIQFVAGVIEADPTTGELSFLLSIELAAPAGAVEPVTELVTILVPQLVAQSLTQVFAARCEDFRRSMAELPAAAAPEPSPSPATTNGAPHPIALARRLGKVAGRGRRRLA